MVTVPAKSGLPSTDTSHHIRNDGSENNLTHLVKSVMSRLRGINEPALFTKLSLLYTTFAGQPTRHRMSILSLYLEEFYSFKCISPTTSTTTTLTACRDMLFVRQCESLEVPRMAEGMSMGIRVSRLSCLLNPPKVQSTRACSYSN